MSALRKTRVMVYSFELTKIAFTDTRLPSLPVGVNFFCKDVFVSIDGLMYDMEHNIYGMSCGVLTQENYGEFEGCSMYYPYGHVPPDIFERYFSENKEWQIVDDNKLGKIIVNPTKICTLEGHGHDEFVIKPW